MSTSSFRIHYRRSDQSYEGWTAYIFGDVFGSAAPYTDGPIAPSGQDDFGAFFDIPIPSAAQRIGAVIHNPRSPSGDVKDPSPDLHFEVGQHTEAWVLSGNANVYTINPLSVTYERLRAHWIDLNTLALPASDYNPAWAYALLSGTESVALISGGTVIRDQLARFPQLDGYVCLKPENLSVAQVKQALKTELTVAAKNSAGGVCFVTGIQVAGVLDELFSYEGPLGSQFAENAISLHLWAPTAQAIDVLLFTESQAEEPASRLPMTEQEGVWRANIPTAYEGLWYLYEVTVYVPVARQILQNRVTDPYSFDLSLDGGKTRLTNLQAPACKPEGWDNHLSPVLDSCHDLSIYELHVRDFSVADQSVPEVNRGTYLAFTQKMSSGCQHLRSLAASGLKAVHLLPTFHIGSINEDKEMWQSPGDLSKYPPDSEEQQAAIAAVKDADAYNWGYDPVHYMAPSGAYAANPEQRVLEYRAMVQALHQFGLRVIQDLVFNHTSSSGQTELSVLDKIVPGYYYRLDQNGNIYNSTCCPNTASENRMMARLMVDTVTTYARHYKINGFRFDLMNFHLVENLRQIQQALSKLSLEEHGVDGSEIYLYGEGWSFGELANRWPHQAATQANLAGTGIGSFNDRIRDAVRGGNPFSDHRTPGFATGLTDLGELQKRVNWIKCSLAAALRDFEFIDHNGNRVRSGQIDFIGQGAGYTANPCEIVNYCSVHDNQTLFDAVQLKSPPDEDTATRTRRQVLAMSIIALGQGIPFFLAGDDLLRSKSMDQNSYNSGDWFNKVDWTGQTNNWGVGLAPARDNHEHWPIHKPLLANPAVKPTPENIQFARWAFQELLRIRYSSPLFRLRSAEEVQEKLQFLNDVGNSSPGLIVMQLTSSSRDPGPFNSVVVAFNGLADAIRVEYPSLKGAELMLHPEQAKSHDPVVRQAQAYTLTGTLYVPALTTAVFVSQTSLHG